MGQHVECRRNSRVRAGTASRRLGDSYLSLFMALFGNERCGRNRGLKQDRHARFGRRVRLPAHCPHYEVGRLYVLLTLKRH